MAHRPISTSEILRRVLPPLQKFHNAENKKGDHADGGIDGVGNPAGEQAQCQHDDQQNPKDAQNNHSAFFHKPHSSR